MCAKYACLSICEYVQVRLCLSECGMCGCLCLCMCMSQCISICDYVFLCVSECICDYVCVVSLCML